MSSLALAGLLLLAAAILLANAPFLSERYFLVVRPRAGSSKGLGWRVLELLVAYFAALGVGLALEAWLGPVYPQRWEFYGITLCLFVVLAYPGFVWRYLRRGAGSRAATPAHEAE